MKIFAWALPAPVVAVALAGSALGAVAADATVITFSGAVGNGQTTLPNTYQPLQGLYGNDGGALGVTIDWGGSWSSKRADNSGVTDHTPGENGLGVVGYDGGASSNRISFSKAVTISSFFYANYFAGNYSVTFNGYANADDLTPSLTISHIYNQPTGYSWIEETGFAGHAIKAFEFSGPVYKQLDDITLAVPEPASWAMMVGGFGLLGAVMRRRKPSTLYA